MLKNTMNVDNETVVPKLESAIPRGTLKGLRGTTRGVRSCRRGPHLKKYAAGGHYIKYFEKFGNHCYRN